MPCLFFRNNSTLFQHIYSWAQLLRYFVFVWQKYCLIMCSNCVIVTFFIMDCLTKWLRNKVLMTIHRKLHFVQCSTSQLGYVYSHVCVIMWYNTTNITTLHQTYMFSFDNAGNIYLYSSSVYSIKTVYFKDCNYRLKAILVLYQLEIWCDI